MPELFSDRFFSIKKGVWRSEISWVIRVKTKKPNKCERETRILCIFSRGRYVKMTKTNAYYYYSRCSLSDCSDLGNTCPSI